MASAHKAVRIDRPADLVFDFLADGTNNPTWQPAVVDVASEDYRPRGWMTLATPLMPLVHLHFRWQTSWLRNAQTTLEARSPQPAAG